MGIGKSGWGVLTSLGRGPGAAQALVGCRGTWGALTVTRGASASSLCLPEQASVKLEENYHL